MLRRYRWWMFSLLVLFPVLIASLAAAPPAPFPSGATVIVARGESIADIAQRLSKAHIVAHPLVLRGILRLGGSATSVRAGAYRFEQPESAFAIARRLSSGRYGIPPARVTLIEGSTVREYAARIAAALPEISASDFLSAGERFEGYLFPDTYNFPHGSSVDSIIATMRENFDAKQATLADDIRLSGHSLSDIVIMASLVEKEARTTESRRMIAGILWNRLALRMPLQVDAVFGYIFGRETYSPSREDLKVDSPYNTYTHRGLPPGPIGNPGLDSLQAVLHPTKTEYLFYLTGTDNQMHYAVTYAAHQANQAKYLK